MNTGFDILIKDTTIIDGSGERAFQGSVGIKGDKIAAVGGIAGEAAQVIDGSGMITSPGFVDPHSHADGSILQFPLAENLIMQGITTVMGGNCGFCPGSLREGTHTSQLGADYPVAWNSYGEWLSTMDAAEPSVNIVSLVGHNTIRELVMGQDFRRAASEAEVDAMKPLVEEAMKSGAFGLSAGLDMPWPGFYADRQETIALAKIAQEYGGLFAPHTRHLRAMWPTDEPTELLYSVYYGPKGETMVGRYHGLLEVVEICRSAHDIPLHIAHFPSAFDIPQPHPASLDEALARATLEEIVDKPRSKGLYVSYNVIATDASICGPVPMIKTFFSQIGPPPPWLEGIQALGPEEFAARLKTRAFREELKAIADSGRFKIGMVHPLKDPYWMDCYRVLKCAQGEYVGKTVGQIARERAPENTVKAVYDASFEVVFDILAEDPDAIWVMALDKRTNPNLLSVFLQHPLGVPCTDVGALPTTPPDEDQVRDHGVTPTAFSLYPQYINTFVKERKVFSLEEGIKKATSVPAQVFGITDRGLIREGAYADILVFDLAALDKGGGFADPTRRPAGIEHVLVNGQMVYQNMSHTGAGPGRVLRRS